MEPLVFHPIPQPRIWGSDRLSTLLGKPFDLNDCIGESWEISGLRGNESRVRGGAFDGLSLTEMIARHHTQLLGQGAVETSEFPLLIKFLDAAQHLSVQVHPKPPAAHVKHEAWYIVHAEPGAELFIGLNEGVTAEDVRRAANTPEMRGLLHARPARAGDCFYLPSGTLHALGAGIVVAEVQTPSDVTYRLYDWERVDASGKPRKLHIDDGLENIRYDVGESEIVQPRRQFSADGHTRTRVCECDRFTIDEWRTDDGTFPWHRTFDRPTILMILCGSLNVKAAESSIEVTTGQTLLLSASLPSASCRASDSLVALEIHPR